MKDKNNAKRNKRNLTLSLIMFILLVMLLTPIKDKLQELVGFKEKNLEKIATIDLKWEKDMKAKGYKDNVIVIDKGNVTSYGYDSKKLWNKKLIKEDEAYLGESGLFINNNKKMIVTKVGIDGTEQWSYKTEHPAYTMTEIDEHLFVYSKVDEKNRNVSIIDKEGKIILNKEKSKEEILSSNISPDKKRFIITSIDNSSKDLKSKLTYLKRNGEIIWTEEVKDRIIYNVLFLNEGKMILVSDKEIICKDQEGETLWQKDIKYNLKDIEVVNGNEIYILYGISDSFLEVLNLEGKIDYKKTFKKEYNDIDQLDKHILFMGKDGILGLNNKQISMKDDFKKDVKQVEKSDDEILTFTNNKLEIFKIVDKKAK